MTRERFRLVAAVLTVVLLPAILSGCFLQRPTGLRAVTLFDLKPGQIYGPVVAPPIFIRLGQSLLQATGTIGQLDDPSRSPAVWEGHALAPESDAAHNRTLFFYVQGDDLRRVSLQIGDQEPIVEENPGAYLSGEFSMVRWLQTYSLRVSAEDHRGNAQVSTIFVDGLDARIDNEQAIPPLNMKLMRLGKTETWDVRGIGFRAKITRHIWPACRAPCDLTAPGEALVAMVSGPMDNLAVIVNERDPIATPLSPRPSPDFVVVAIPVRDETWVEIAARNEFGDLASVRWDRPG